MHASPVAVGRFLGDEIRPACGRGCPFCFPYYDSSKEATRAETFCFILFCRSTANKEGKNVLLTVWKDRHAGLGRYQTALNAGRVPEEMTFVETIRRMDTISNILLFLCSHIFSLFYYSIRTGMLV